MLKRDEICTKMDELMAARTNAGSACRLSQSWVNAAELEESS